MAEEGRHARKNSKARKTMRPSNRQQLDFLHATFGKSSVCWSAEKKRRFEREMPKTPKAGRQSRGAFPYGRETSLFPPVSTSTPDPRVHRSPSLCRSEKKDSSAVLQQCSPVSKDAKGRRECYPPRKETKGDKRGLGKAMGIGGVFLPDCKNKHSKLKTDQEVVPACPSDAEADLTGSAQPSDQRKIPVARSLRSSPFGMGNTTASSPSSSASSRLTSSSEQELLLWLSEDEEEPEEKSKVSFSQRETVSRGGEGGGGDHHESKDIGHRTERREEQIKAESVEAEEMRSDKGESRVERNFADPSPSSSATPVFGKTGEEMGDAFTPRKRYLSERSDLVKSECAAEDKTEGRDEKRQRLEEEVMETHLELKFTQNAERQQNLEKMIQRLVEERLRLQLSVFDKSLQELRQRVETIEFVTEQHNVLKSLQAPSPSVTSNPSPHARSQSDPADNSTLLLPPPPPTTTTTTTADPSGDTVTVTAASNSVPAPAVSDPPPVSQNLNESREAEKQVAPQSKYSRKCRPAPVDQNSNQGTVEQSLLPSGSTSSTSNVLTLSSASSSCALTSNRQPASILAQPLTQGVILNTAMGFQTLYHSSLQAPPVMVQLPLGSTILHSVPLDPWFIPLQNLSRAVTANGAASNVAAKPLTAQGMSGLSRAAPSPPPPTIAIVSASDFPGASTSTTVSNAHSEVNTSTPAQSLGKRPVAATSVATTATSAASVAAMTASVQLKEALAPVPVMAPVPSPGLAPAAMPRQVAESVSLPLARCLDSGVVANPHVGEHRSTTELLPKVMRAAAAAPPVTGATPSSAKVFQTGTSDMNNPTTSRALKTPAKITPAHPSGDIIDLTEDDEHLEDSEVTSTSGGRDLAGAAAVVTPIPSTTKSRDTVTSQTCNRTILAMQSEAFSVTSSSEGTVKATGPQHRAHHRPQQVKRAKNKKVSPSEPRPSTSRTQTSRPPLPPFPRPVEPAFLPPGATKASVPQQPRLELAPLPDQSGIVLSWSVPEESHTCADAQCYQLYAYQKGKDRTLTPLSESDWKKIGQIKALPLPMVCTLTQFLPGSRYYFTVRAVDVYGRSGPFSEPQGAESI